MENMKYVLIGFRRYKVDEEEFDHYHIEGYPLSVSKIDIITLIPNYLGHFSERRHIKNLRKGKRMWAKKYITPEEMRARAERAFSVNLID
jgi:hypothetical protein